MPDGTSYCATWLALYALSGFMLQLRGKLFMKQMLLSQPQKGCWIVTFSMTPNWNSTCTEASGALWLHVKCPLRHEFNTSVLSWTPTDCRSPEAPETHEATRLQIRRPRRSSAGAPYLPRTRTKSPAQQAMQVSRGN